MVKLITVLGLLFAVSSFAGSCPEGGCCGVKLVGAHVVEATECPANEVMVGMPDMESVKCAKIECGCGSCPEQNPGQDPGQCPGQDPGQCPGQNPGQCPGKPAK